LPVVQVAFNIHCPTRVGESVAVVGSHPTLGSWDISQAQALQWSQGHIWTGSLTFAVQEAPKSLEYKAIFFGTDGKVSWEKGDNHQLLLEGGAEVNASWTFS
jgi:hypothetical protein